jgi:AcrR family transcriptional regulator
LPRDSTDTKARLVREAEHLFARRGVYQVTVREITAVAGQRNVSALNYHFGGREGILQAILHRHGGPLDLERGEVLAGLRADPGVRGLIDALLVPLARRLSTADGRDYLRIVAQLTGAFSTWRVVDEPNLRRILEMLEDTPADLARPVRRERVVAIILLMTAAMAERARAMESRKGVEIDETTFVANLGDMIVGALTAPGYAGSTSTQRVPV